MATTPPRGDDDDTSTPVDFGRRLEDRVPNSFDRVSIGTTESAIVEIANNLSRLRERWDQASTVERRALAERIAPEARQVGDLFHDFARWMSEYSVGR